MKKSKIIHVMFAPDNWQTNPEYVYIGRQGKGLSGYFGNPCSQNEYCVVCHRVHHVRGATLGCYEKYLINRLARDSEFKQKFLELQGKILVCFCTPPACHGVVIQKHLDLLANK